MRSTHQKSIIMIRHRPRFRSALSGRLLPLLLTLGLSLGLIACNESTPPPGTKVAPAVQQRFQQLDRDNDGRLSPSELNRPRLFQVADREPAIVIAVELLKALLHRRRDLGAGRRRALIAGDQAQAKA
jgi:hypothetical protein